jgi:hypothetical protein
LHEVYEVHVEYSLCEYPNRLSLSCRQITEQDLTHRQIPVISCSFNQPWLEHQTGTSHSASPLQPCLHFFSSWKPCNPRDRATVFPLDRSRFRGLCLFSLRANNVSRSNAMMHISLSPQMVLIPPARSRSLAKEFPTNANPAPNESASVPPGRLIKSMFQEPGTHPTSDTTMKWQSIHVPQECT